MTLGKELLIGFLLLGISIFAGEAKVLDDTCSPPTGGAADECTVDNSECKTDKCVCKIDFIRENGACPKALGQPCTKAEECVTNSKCDGAAESSKTCTCKDGFFTEDGLCSKAIGSDCDTSTLCPTDSNTECKTDKCDCKKDYEEKNDACTLIVSGIDCSSVTTACDIIGNAVCDTGKCKCKPDYVMNVDKCDPKNAATTIEFGALSLALVLSTASFMLF